MGEKLSFASQILYALQILVSPTYYEYFEFLYLYFTFLLYNMNIESSHKTKNVDIYLYLHITHMSILYRNTVCTYTTLRYGIQIRFASN